MNRTMGEQAMSLLNYSLASRQSTPSNHYTSNSYPDALKTIVDIYVKSFSNNKVTLEEVENFYNMLSCANYLDNKSCYPNLANVILYSQNILSNVVNNHLNLNEENSIVR